MNRFRSALRCALIAAACILASPAGAQVPPIAAALADEEQQYVDQFVRTYERASSATIPLAIIAGAWSMARPSELSVFGGFLFAGVEYGMFLTGARSDPVSRTLVWTHLGAGVVGGTLAYFGLETLQRRKQAERRRRQNQLELIPAVVAGRPGLTLTSRF